MSVSGSRKTAFITGVTGQDGSYLTEFLLSKGYLVHGMVRRTSSLERSRLGRLYRDADIYNKLFYAHYADLSDPTTIRRILTRVEPDEIYHLAGQSHVGIGFDTPESTCELTAMATLRLLEINRDLAKPARFYNASSSEVFGRPESAPQSEETPMKPVNPYGCAKAFATHFTSVSRDSLGVFACNGICFNHESPRRGENFVTRKIARAAAEVKLGRRDKVGLGNLDTRRDWGFAGEYVAAMWLMLQQDRPADYVLATGESHSVREFLSAAFGRLSLRWEDHVYVDERYYRPVDAVNLVGDASKARRELNWRAETRFEDLVAMMVDAEMDAV